MEAQLLDWEEAVAQRARRKWNANAAPIDDEDALVVEAPLEIRLGNLPLAVVMRTPGHDVELATGFALTELIVSSAAELQRVVKCDDEASEGNVVRLIPQTDVDIDPTRFQRNLFTTSSCGVCGKRSIDRAMAEAPALDSRAHFDGGLLASLPQALSVQQPIFQRTGALHAAALVASCGTILCVREDIGRHNAVDKTVGWAARANEKLTDACLVVSGRASYEIVQKALAARISCIVAVGGVSSLAVDLAERAGIAVVGFARSGSLSIYAHPERIL